MTQPQPQPEQGEPQHAERTPERGAPEAAPRQAREVPSTTPHEGARNDGEDLSPDDFE